MVLTLLAADNGSTRQVQSGEQIAVLLGENLSTGYGWTLEAVEGNLTYCGTVLDDPSERTFTFRAGPEAGSGKIKLKRWRNWLGEAGVSERFAAEIEVLS